MNRTWRSIATFVLRFRIPILALIAAITVFMWFSKATNIDQAFSKIIPERDAEFQRYLKFKKEFGEDGNGIVVCMPGDIFRLETFNHLYEISEKLALVEGVDAVISPTHLVNLDVKEDAEGNGSFQVRRIVTQKARSQAEVDSLKAIILGLDFYRGLVFSDSADVSLMVISVNQKYLDTKRKHDVYRDVLALTTPFEQASGMDLKYTGLPVIRVNVSAKLPREMTMFLGLSLFVMALTLFFFYRSFYMVIFPLVVVGVIVIWSQGILGLLGYEIKIITGLIPALVTVIGVPNTVYLVTKYHIEYRRTGNQAISLINVIEKIGLAAVMTNATTAVGLGVTAFTQIKMLREFGIVGSLSVMVAFFISVLLIPIIFSFLPPPTARQVRHLDYDAFQHILAFLDRVSKRYRRWVYVGAAALLIVSIIGIYRIETVSYMLDEVPNDDEMMADLKFVESKFRGVMPFEILIDTKKNKGAFRPQTLRKLRELQDSLAQYDQISRTLSIADMAMFSRQALWGIYAMPDRNELAAIQSYLENVRLDEGNLSRRLVDSNRQKVRITGNIRDIGSVETMRLVDSIQKDMDAIFPPDNYDTEITGTTKIFIRGNSYLINNLFRSLTLALVLIAILMGFTFRQLRMVLISLVPNILPLVMVAGLMGFAGIHLKISSAIIFSVSLGIAVDCSIHYLVRYRLARRAGDDISTAITNSFRDIGLSMIYTSLILSLGFSIFAFSSVGGIKVMGFLCSATLLLAMLSNLILLPALLMAFDKKTDTGEEPIFDEALTMVEEDETGENNTPH